jgi:hypothetical protein
MKTGAIAILILLMTGGALAVANKACKSSDHPWCVRSLHSQNGKALGGAGRARNSKPQTTSAGSAAASDVLGAAKL